MLKRIIRCSLFSVLLPALVDAASFEVKPFEVMVIDRQSAEPVEGALVVASYISRGGVHAVRKGVTYVQEALTDERGYASFSGWKRKEMERGFGPNEPTIGVWKIGYTAMTKNTVSERRRSGEFVVVSQIRLMNSDALIVENCDSKDEMLRYFCFVSGYSGFMGGLGPIKPWMSQLPETKAQIEAYEGIKDEFK